MSVKASLAGPGRQPVYVVDFAVYKPPEELIVDRELAEERGKSWALYSESVRDFMVKVVSRSGLSQNGTYLPRAINPILTKEPVTDINTAMMEAKMVMTGAVQQLLDRTGLCPADIDILVTNCSIFCPTPSLSSMLINHFKLRSDIQSYHLGGMGCGNGVMAIGLIRDLLQARPNSVALFVPAEITTYAFYPGAHKTYMVANCIFRMGGAAVLLSNKGQYSRTAKYQLQYNARVHTGQDDDAYRCMSWGPDPDGVNGVYLGKNVVSCAGAALQACLKAVTPRIMTWSQWAAAASHWLCQAAGKELPPYQPDFTGCIDHFAIHAGGYAVLKGIQSGMSLPPAKMLPSFAALRDYGNTSCSTTWYVLAYMECCDKVLQGQRIMQVGMGGGMKAGVNIWVALNNNTTQHPAWTHLAGRPITEDDLPRSIEAMGSLASTTSSLMTSSSSLISSPSLSSSAVKPAAAAAATGEALTSSTPPAAAGSAAAASPVPTEPAAAAAAADGPDQGPFAAPLAAAAGAAAAPVAAPDAGVSSDSESSDSSTDQASSDTADTADTVDTADCEVVLDAGKQQLAAAAAGGQCRYAALAAATGFKTYGDFGDKARSYVPSRVTM